MKPNILGWTALAGLVALLALALPAAAEYYEGKPDCPPDMACTLSVPADEGNATAGDPGAFGPEDCIDCTKAPEARGPEDCESCRSDEGNVSDEPTYDGNCGGEVCATSHQPADGGTCMDGAAPTELCDRDVQYLDGGAGAPQQSHTEASADQRTVPGLGVLGLALAGLGVAALVAARRKL